jgi:hypothetical protein
MQSETVDILHVTDSAYSERHVEIDLRAVLPPWLGGSPDSSRSGRPLSMLSTPEIMSRSEHKICVP